MRYHDVSPRLIALLAILSGCSARPSDDDAAGVVACNEEHSPFEVHACLGRIANPAPTAGADYYIDGVVTAPPPAEVSCLLRRDVAAPLVQRYGLTSKDDNWVLVIATNGAAWPLLANGESVSVRYLRLGDHQHLMIRDAAGTRALFGDGAKLAQMVMPSDVDLSEGDASCQSNAGCIVNLKQRLRVTSQGLTWQVEPRLLTDFGGLRVFTEGVVRPTPAGCAVPDVTRATFAVLRL